MANLVIGIEGLVGTGKTSICRELLNMIPNSIILHAGNIYRAITYRIMTSNVSLSELKDIDLQDLFKRFEIEIKIENKETVVYSMGHKIDEQLLQSAENSVAVSKISGMANNKNAYKLVKQYIDSYKENYNVIFSGRDTKRIYPELDYHLMLTADIDKRVEWKAYQYPNISKDELKEQIELRDELQRKSGYYDTYDDTITIDLSEYNTIEEKTKVVYDKIFKSGDKKNV